MGADAIPAGSPWALGADYPVVILQPVQWGEMDAFNHVNNVTYLRWFETGRAAYFRATRLWDDGIGGISPILHSVGCRFRAALVYPDDVEIGVRVKDVGEDRFTLEHAVYSRTQKLVAAQGEGIIVAYDYPKKTKCRLPEAWREAIARVEGRT